MGYRLHVCKKYDVQYADIADFNWKSETVSRLFSLLQMENFWEDDNNDDFEIYKPDFLEKISYLKSLPSSDENYQDILALCDALGYPNPADLAARLKEFADAADPSDDYIHFSFF